MAKEKAKKAKKKTDSFIVDDSEEGRKPKKEKRECKHNGHVLSWKLTLCSGTSFPDPVVPCYS